MKLSIDIPTQDVTIPVIAIDGGAGTGKGAARAEVASRLEFHGLDSGLLYRAVGMKADGTDLSVERLVDIALSLDLRMEGETVYLDGRDQTAAIRSDPVGMLASNVAKIPEVRQALLAFQLNMRKRPGLVTDGRDQCDIFDTPHRFFFIAEPEERARRRVKQLLAFGKPADYAATLQKIKERDFADANRLVQPLRPHPQAVVIDTTYRSITDVADRVIACYHFGPR